MYKQLFEYTILDEDSGLAKAGTIQVTKFLGVNENGELEIPEKIDGTPVTSLRTFSSGIYYQENGKWIVVEIKKLIIPSSIVDIQRSMNIAKMLPPVTERLIVSDDNPCYSTDGVCLFSKDGTVLLDQAVRTVEQYKVPDGVVRIAEQAFKNTNTARIYLPDSVGILEWGSFEGSKSIIEIAGGYGLREVDFHAFTDSPFAEKPYFVIGNTLIKCTPAESEYTVPDGIECIAGSAFQNGSPLVKIRFPASLKMIGNSALYGFDKLQDVELPDGLMEIGPRAFSKTGVRSISIPSSVKIVQHAAFSDCPALEEVVFQKQSEGIAFDNEHDCGIAPALFSDCPLLRTVILPEGIVSIENNAFSGCESLKDIVLPKSLHRIGNNAFSGCKALVEVLIPENVEDISPLAFAKCDCKIQIDDRNGTAACALIDNVLFTNHKKKLSLYPADSQESVYSVPEGTEEIAPSAFANNTNLKRIELPKSIIKIGEGAFANCRSLETITIPDTLTELPDRAFCDCQSLQNVQISSGIRSIGEECFANTKLSSVYIPNTVECIKDYAFEGISVDSVTLPPSVKTIGCSIFPGAKEITIYDTLAPNAKTAEAYFDDANGSFGETRIGSMGILQKPYYAWGACNSIWNDHMIIVRSAATNEIRYKIWMGGVNQPRNVYCALASGWGRNAEFAFELLDNQVFGKMKSIPDKQKTAVIRILWPEKLSDAARKRYVSYISKNAREILATCISEDRLDVIQALEPLKILKADNINELCGTAVKHGKTQIAAWLIQYRETHFAEALKGKESLEIDGEATPIWQYSKKKEALVGRYLGTESNVIFPKELEGQKVLGIAGVNAREIPENYQAIEKIEIPDGYESIGQNAFAGCKNLREVILPDTIKEIGKGAFANCASLESIRLPASLKNINLQSFKNCTALKKVIIHEDFKGFIGKEAFMGCSSLERVDVQMCVAMEQWAFADSGLKVFIAHGDAYCLNNNPFRGCYGYTIYANPGTTIYGYIKSKSKSIDEAPVE